MSGPRNLLLVALFSLPPRLIASCLYPGNPSEGLAVRPGYTAFLPESQLVELRRLLPSVTNTAVDAALRSPDTIWYDESSMVYSYQDSIETVTGVRANCVGRKVGENNPNNPGIAKLTRYFGADFRFLFPFRKAAGTEQVNHDRVVNFWVPPTSGNQPLPVKYWKNSSRGHWYWTFPVGTLFGEVLMQRAPTGDHVVYEIRTRKRYSGGWSVDVFRPFTTAGDLASAAKRLRPDWAMSMQLRKWVNHLENSNTLTPARWESPAFSKVFSTIEGALDILPDSGDPALILKLLRTTAFHSAEGAIWKENGSLETYAAGSAAEFNIVPKGYDMGLVPVNEVSCNRCHSEASRRLETFESDIVLYGEVWGEDRIFTWHPFEVKKEIFNTWDEVDGSRVVNPRLKEAGLVRNEKPLSNDHNYIPQASAFDAGTKP